ncbi:MAG: cation acetate symporter, partial [Bacteroidetes bacterium]|nr:cation acetate symporter [Bacteroidota bacterium]
ILTFVIGFGAMVLVGQDVISSVDKGGNMAALLLSEAVGGQLFLGFIAAVAFATILAVVAGLTLSGASTLSHDLYVNVVKSGKTDEAGEVRVARISTVFIGTLAILLGLLFKGQNVAFTVGLAFAIAASANFPSLLLSILWKRYTTKGAVASIVTGAGLAVILIILSPTVWVEILHFEKAIFPLKNPALFSMTASFIVGAVVSLMTDEPEARDKFEDEKLRTYLGIGAE